MIDCSYHIYNVALGQKYTGGGGSGERGYLYKWEAKTDARNNYAHSGVSSIDKTRNKKREPLC